MIYLKLQRLALQALTAVGSIALVVMTAWTVVDVASRHVVAQPLRGSIDLVESALVLVVFLALPTCFEREEQITVDVLDHALKPRGVQVLKLLASLAALAFTGLLVYAMWQPMVDAFRFEDRKPDLPIATWWLLAAIEVSMLTTAAVLLSMLASQAKRALTRGQA